MRLTTVILLASLMQVSAATFGQRITLDRQNTPLSVILTEIRKQSGYDIFYDNKLVSKNQKVSLKLANVSVDEALKAALKGLELTYEINDKDITVKKKTSSFLDRLVSAFSIIDLRGRVVDEKGKPMAGATVTLTKSGTSAVCDANGYFKIKANLGEVLLISYVGYATEEVTVKNETGVLNVVLKEVSGKLDETIVIGYGTTTKRLNIGAATNISAADIKNQPVTNILSALQGMVPGLEISNSGGAPGAAVQIRLRGINTMNDVSKTSENGTGFVALVLVDGVPVTDISFLSAGDVESIDVLKDAAATAIYGSRAAGGVILITTKRGLKGTGPGKLTFNGYTSITNPTHTVPMLNSEQYLVLRREGYKNDGVTVSPALAPDLYMNNSVNTDWRKILYQNALSQDYQLNFSGGSPVVSYYLSGGYRNEAATIKGDWYLKRANARIGLDARVSDKLTIGGNAAFTNSKGRSFNSAIPSLAYYALPLIPADSAGQPNLKAYLPPFLNPNRILTEFTRSNTNVFLGNFYFNYNILKGLYFRTDVSAQATGAEGTNFSPSTSVPFSNSNFSAYPAGRYTNVNNNAFTIEPQFNYAFNLGGHALKLLAGGTYIDRTSKSQTIAMTGYSSDLLTSIASATKFSFSNYVETPYKFASAFGRVTYNYREKYLAEAVFRRDGSSRFGENYQYGNFWSIGTGWIFSQEPFIRQLFGKDFYGKLKATYGITGNDNIGDFGYLSYSSTGIYGGNNATYLNNIANPYLRWEQTSKLDFGLDLNMLKNRLNISANYFRHRTKGTLFSQALSVVSGFSSITGNLDGSVANNGFELSVTGKPVQSKDFNWTSTFNISFLKNKLLDLPGLNNLPVFNRYSYKVGEPLALNWGVKYLGVDPKTGLAMFEDVDKSNSIASFSPDFQVIGKSIPDFYGGWNNTFSYKKIDLQVFAQFVNGVQKRYTTYTSFIGDVYNLPLSALNRWQKEGDVTDIPRATAPGTPASFNNSNLSSSSFAYSNAAYIRIKTISLGYNVPAIPKLGITNLRVFATGYNLFTITNYKGADPESGSSLVPVSKNFTLGVNFSF